MASGMDLTCVWCGQTNVHVCNDTIKVGDFEEDAIHFWCEFCPGISILKIRSGKGTAEVYLDKPVTGWQLSRILKDK